MITIFTDGSCDKNHQKKNRGGWAYVAINDSGINIFEAVGGENDTTNNRMEMCAVLNALKTVKQKHTDENVTIYSDSEYVVNTLTKNWKRNKNNDLWDQLDSYMSPKITLKWVKGHSNNVWNEYVDKLASTKTLPAYTVK